MNAKAHPGNAPRILLISFTQLLSDSRALRQAEMLANIGTLTTVAFGEPPPSATQHVRIPDGLSSLPETLSGVIRLGLRAHRSAEMSSPATRFTRDAVERGAWDLVVANDARTLDVADHLAHDAPVWVDLREWAPEEWSDIWRWRTFVGPFMRHLCSRYLPQVALSTTPAPKAISLYKEHFNITPLLMRNAPRLQAIEPSPTIDGNIRLVHGGAAIHGRGIEELCDVVDRLPDRFTLDLYLLPSRDQRFYDRIAERGKTHPRINVHPPVAALDVPRTFSEYDVGVYFLPWTNPNTKYSLPNKFFDFIQARLALAIGPSPEMQAIVDQHGLGVVAAGFDIDSACEALLTFTSENIRAFKLAADAASAQLSFEADERVVQAALTDLLAERAGAAGLQKLRR